MIGLNDDIEQIESVLSAVNEKTLAIAKARRLVRGSLQNLAQVELDTSLTLTQTFESIAQNCTPNARRNIGVVAIRLVSFSDFLSTSDAKEGRRHIVWLIEHGCPDLTLNLRWKNGALSHEKLESIKSIHRVACEHLDHLRQQYNNLEELVSRRQIILRDLNHGPTKNYLSAFGFKVVQPSANGLINQIAGLVNSEGYELQENMERLLETLDEEIELLRNIDAFVIREYWVPFLKKVQSLVRTRQETMAENFACTIEVPSGSYEIEKKFPLHLQGYQVHVSVPLTNKGPGTAQDVRACCVADYCNVQSDELSLGNVRPGSFILPLIVSVTQPRESISVEVEVNWRVVGDPSDHAREFSVKIGGQRTDVDWDQLRLQQPYSLEVAYDQDFFGRKDAVLRILRRLAPNVMQSCYITGQKRVGKSSLARAVETRIRNDIHPGRYQVLYLECGEFRHSSGKDTLGDLGTQLEGFLTGELPHIADWSPRDYSSSLARLNTLLNQLAIHKPESRFVVILDEFDEINESLYRHGELASTFFLNLRTLSSKKNLAFVLVGAERMPYVMSSQGEKLNKFGHESLDSFDKETEWVDYCELIRTPIEASIKIHEAALRKCYELTQGHPYFTKVLCATIYASAVEARDAEISTGEVKRAADRVVSTLDTNAFAHYWRDGILGDSNEIEIVSLNRCRVLVAWARTARQREALNWESIGDRLHSSTCGREEVLPILDDLCRRGVFRECDGEYRPTVELFSGWLTQGGFSKLVSDKLGEELAEAKQGREDSAYVQASEIVDLADKWDSYQGRRISEEKIRAWLNQVSSNVEQRLLFKLLQNIRFFHDLEVRKKLEDAHAWVNSKLPILVRTSRAQRRKDIFVSFADGHGKSGAHFASLYANVNKIASSNVVSPSDLGRVFGHDRSDNQTALVIVDDFIGTGKNLLERLSALDDVFQQARIGTDVPLSIIVLAGTVRGEKRVRAHLEENMPSADLEICEMVERNCFAFGKSLGFWDTDEEKSSAKTLVMNLGVRVQKRRPLGYQDEGMLLTFSRNCPNNSLPILHGMGKIGTSWTPLFPRMKT